MEVSGGGTPWHPAQEAWKPSRSQWTVSWKVKPAGTLPQLPDLVGIHLGEPEVGIGPRRDALGAAARRRDRELADFAGERQGAGSSKRQHADEQAQEPAEQGETQ